MIRPFNTKASLRHPLVANQYCYTEAYSGVLLVNTISINIWQVVGAQTALFEPIKPMHDRLARGIIPEVRQFFR